MPVRIDIIDFKCFNQLRNGEAFDRNLSEFTPNLVGNIAERVKVEYTANIEQSANTEDNDEWFIINDPSFKQIERSSGSFLDDNIQVGDVYQFYADWENRRSGSPEYTGTVDFISSDGKILRYTVDSGTDSTSGTVDNKGIAFVLSEAPVSVFEPNFNTALFAKFGLLENSETFNFLSKTTEAQQVYYVGELVRADPAKDAESLGTIKDWVTGSMTVEFTGNQPDFLGAQYIITHEFVLNPFYILSFRQFIENGTIPALLAGDSSIKYAVELEFRKTLTDTGSSKIGDFAGLPGFVGWYGENFNGLNKKYEVVSVAYKEAVSTDSLEGVNINTSTKATITVSNVDGAITDYSCSVYIFRVPDSEDDYIGTTSNLVENFLLKSEIVSNPDTTSPNVTTSIVSGDLVIEYTIDYSTAEKLQLSTDDEYILLVQVEDPNISAGNSDRVMLLADFRNYVDVDFLSDFIQINSYGFLLHGQELGVDTSNSSVITSNEDGILLNAVFGVNNVGRNVIVNNIAVALLAYNQVENKSFELDRYDFSLGETVFTGNAQQIEVNTTRGYPLPVGDQFNIVKIETGLQSGDFRLYNLQFGQKIKWQDWIFNPSVDSVFFNSAFPNNNLNEKSSNYSGEQNYEIRVALIINVSGEDDLGRNLTGDFINYGGVVTVNDYEESEDGVSGIIQTFDVETGQSLEGNILYNGKDTLFKAVFQNAAAMQYGIHRIEPSQNPGDGILELSSLLPSVPSNLLKPLNGETLLKFELVGSELTTECLIDGSLIQEGLSYKLSARTGNLPISLSFFSQWDTNNISGGSSNANQISLPLLAAGAYNFIVDWGDGNQDTITQWDQAEVTHTYAASGIYDIQIGGLIRGWGFGGSGDRLKILDVTQWGDVQFTNNTANNGAFEGCANLDVTATDIPDFSIATNLSSFFSGCSSLVGNSSFNSWDVSQILSLGSFFNFCSSFNQSLSNWETGNVAIFRNFLFGASSYSQSLNDWDVSSGTLFENMLRQTSYNQPLNNWVISSATNMNAFLRQTPFNQNINNWVLPASLTRMQGFFLGCSSYNQPLDNWDVQNVEDFGSMFSGATMFDQDITGWNMVSATNLRNMFFNANAFNRDISGWNTPNVTSTEFMFDNADIFNRNLATWLITSNLNANSMFRNTALSTANLDAILIGWAAQAPNIQNNVVFGAENTARSAASDAAVTLLTGTYGWTINTL